MAAGENPDDPHGSLWFRLIVDKLHARVQEGTNRPASMDVVILLLRPRAHPPRESLACVLASLLL